jgi:hypothetical protein
VRVRSKTVSGVVQKPRSQVVSDLPCSKNPGPRWSLIGTYFIQRKLLKPRLCPYI